MTDTTSQREPVSAAGRAGLALALDVDDSVAALRLARELRPWFGVAKVGLELYSAAGPDVIGSLTDLGYDVFVDIKLHDIPTTVGRAARVMGALGARYLTMHAAGGEAMLRAGVDAFTEGAERAGLPRPTALAVTILTSEADAPPALLEERVAIALAAGCPGIICAAPDLPVVKALGPDLVAFVPGIRPAGAPTHDQARAATPAEARQAGADVLVIGRAVTAADDPAQAAEALVRSLAP